MYAHINGERRQLTRTHTLHDLLVELQLIGKRLAIELNGEIVPRTRYTDQPIHEGDQVEIIHAVGGG